MSLSAKRRDPGRRATSLMQAGFSLFEILAVLVVLGIMASLAVPASFRIADNIDFRRQTEKILATLRYARLLSVTRGREVRVMLDQENPHALRLSGAVSEYREYDLAEGDQLVLQPEEIVFFAESQATPATVFLTRGERVSEIVLDPLTAMPVME